MAIRQFYDNQADIPSELAEHYLEKDNRWIIQTEPQIEDVAGLKTALNTERGLRRDAEKTVTDLKVRFDGIDPDEVVTMRDKLKSLDDKEIYDKQGIEALVTKRTDTMRTDFDRVLRMKDGEIGNLKASLASEAHSRKQEMIRTALLQAVSGAGVHEHAIEDAVARGLSIFNDVDEAKQVISKQGDELKYGKDGINPLSPQEWIATLKTEGKARHLWPGSSGGGAPASHGGNGAGIDYSSITNPAERMTLFRQQQAAQNR